MSKTYRVYELAKEFHADSKALVSFLNKNGFKVSNNFSSVGQAEYDLVHKAFEKKQEEKKAEEKHSIMDYSVADGRPGHTSPHKMHPVKQEAKPVQEKPKKQEKAEPVAAEAKPAKPAAAEKPVQKPETKPEKKAEPKPEEPKKVEEPKKDTPFRGLRIVSMPSENKARRENARREASHNEPRKQEHASAPRPMEAHASEPAGGRGEGGRKERRSKDRGNQHDRHTERAERSERRASKQNRKDRRANKHDKVKRQPQKVEIARPTHIKVGESIAVKDLASKMSCTAAEVIKKLFLMGVMATINQVIDFDTAALVASEFGVSCEELPPDVDPTLIPEIEDDPKSLKPRPPIVTVMGHVDHGKTSLLDRIRNTHVTKHEAGGITQHIGAYQVNCNGKKIVFLDTPGHEAFTAMRARGAQITDIAILVVAADDGVMPQTIEAIHHAKSADVPIIVAINKIDKPGANPDHVKNELMEQGLVPEDYGGDTIMVPISAKKGIGIDDLLENVLLVAEVQELKANPNRDARGVIIEAKLDKGRGPVATVLVQNGTLRVGDSVVCGTTYGKVRAMVNEHGGNVKKAGPSVPVEILGLNDVPAAGDVLAVLEDKQARSIAEARIELQRNNQIKAKKVSLDDLFHQIQEGEIKDLNIVIKADVQGSVEALSSSLLKLNKNDEVRVSIVHSGVGAVNESDVMLASASNAIIIAFNVHPDANARRVAEAENIDIRTYRVIYDAINDVKDAMSGMLKPKYKEVIQGRVEIRKVMKFSKALVAGSYVLDGKICNNSKIRILRDNVEVFDGEIDSLRRFKDEVKEVQAGYECGISIVDFRDFHEGDIIEAYTMEEVEVSIADANKAAAERRKAEEEKKAAAAAEAEDKKED